MPIDINLGSQLNSLLNNPSAKTAVDGTPVSSATTPASNRASNSTSSRQPMVLPSAIRLPSQFTDTATNMLRVPTTIANQPQIRSAITDVISTTLTGNKNNTVTDVGSAQYNGSVSTQLFSGIRSTMMSNAPTFGLSTGKASPLADSLFKLANTAVNVGKQSMFAKYGTTVLKYEQYSVFADAVVKNFQKSYDESPLSDATKAAINIKQFDKIVLPRPPNVTTTPIANLPDLKGTPLERLSAGGSIAQATNITSNADTNQETETNSEGSETQYKVYLVSALNDADKFIFRAQPQIQITESANYTNFSPIHAPGEILAFQNSPAREFNISDIKLFSRTPYEAQQNLESVHLLRAWTKPYFGKALAVKPPSAQKQPMDPITSSILQSTREARTISKQGAIDAYNTDEAAKAAAVAAAETKSLAARYPAPIKSTATSSTAATAVDVENQTNITKNRVASTIEKNLPPQIELATSKVAPVLPVEETLVKDSTGQYGPVDPSQTTPMTVNADTALNVPEGTISNTIGSPPEILYLYGYSSDGMDKSNKVQNLRRIPVVITSISITYPNDVDYIPTKQGVPFPTMMSVTITLKETKSPYELEQFSLLDYKAGKLIGW